jgi:hypothetical protein
MTRISLAILGCSALFLCARGASSQDKPLPTHVSAGNFDITADNVTRSNPPGAGANPYPSEVQARGHVEIRVCCMQRPVSPVNPNPAKAYLIMHADEVEYSALTDVLETRGSVEVNFQDLSPR